MANFVGDVLKDFVEIEWLQNKSRGWTEAMAAAFLKPYGVSDIKKSTVTCLGTKGKSKTLSEQVGQNRGRICQRAWAIREKTR